MTNGRVASYTHHIPIRYGEVDMQGVVFNAHYMAYIDDACDTWLRQQLGRFEDFGWEPMVVKAVIEWQGGAGMGDALDISLGVSRWGNTSFDVGFTGVVGERPVFTATITYVGVSRGDHTPIPMPDNVRAALS
jgi:acyl-CoA thioester hydrolase